MPKKKSDTLKPGSKEARDAGCICPVLDNEHGRGWMGMPGVYIYREDCPIHAEKFAEISRKHDARLNKKLKKKKVDSSHDNSKG